VVEPARSADRRASRLGVLAGLLSPLIYGGHWRFGALTRPFWIRLAANVHESSVHLGFSVIALALYAWRKRRTLNAPRIGLFTFLLVFFLVLAFGPTPQIAAKAILGEPRRAALRMAGDAHPAARRFRECRFA
jgi:hypothetical protein